MSGHSVEAGPEYFARARVFLTVKENVMLRLRVLSAALASLAIAAVTAGIHASGHGRTLVVTMTNDQNANEIKVYDAESHALLQTLSTHGKGGVEATREESSSSTAGSWRSSTTDPATSRCSGEMGTR